MLGLPPKPYFGAGFELGLANTHLERARPKVKHANHGLDSHADNAAHKSLAKANGPLLLRAPEGLQHHTSDAVKDAATKLLGALGARAECGNGKSRSDSAIPVGLLAALDGASCSLYTASETDQQLTIDTA
jgi:hypothetical protein